MMYPFMTLDDNTEVVHSEVLQDGKVKVYFENPDEKDCYHSVTCYLPGYNWTEINGFSEREINRYQELLSCFLKKYLTKQDFCCILRFTLAA